MDEKPKQKYRVSTPMFVAMVIVALILDLISLIPVINVATLAFAGIIFTLWWWLLKLGLINFKKVITYGLSAIVEFIPTLSILPGITAAVIVIFAFSRVEDKTGISLTSKFSKTPKISKARNGKFSKTPKIARSKESQKPVLQMSEKEKAGGKKTARKNQYWTAPKLNYDHNFDYKKAVRKDNPERFDFAG